MITRASFSLALLRCILFSLTAISTQSVMAQSNNTASKNKPLKYYDIEIILFKNLKVPKANEKILPSQAPLLDKQFISFATPSDIKAAAGLSFIIPPENEFRLIDMVKRIKRSSRYKLLSHKVWRQPGLAAKDALAIQIRAGKTFGNDYSSIDSSVPRIKLMSNNDKKSEFKRINLRANRAKNVAGKVWYELEGKITITLARYLHTYVDLVLRIPSENTIQYNMDTETAHIIDLQDENSLTSATLNNFAFKEHRRMRSRKLHYLDHPELGMLILITPYQAPQKIEFIDE